MMRLGLGRISLAEVGGEDDVGMLAGDFVMAHVVVNPTKCSAPVEAACLKSLRYGVSP